MQAFCFAPVLKGFKMTTITFAALETHIRNSGMKVAWAESGDCYEWELVSREEFHVSDGNFVRMGETIYDGVRRISVHRDGPTPRYVFTILERDPFRSKS